MTEPRREHGNAEARVVWKVTVERTTITAHCGDAYCSCAEHRSKDSWTFWPDGLSIEQGGIHYAIQDFALVTIRA